MKLFIAEKPAVANDIVKGLGGNFIRKEGYYESDKNIVTFCYGHILESIPPENYNPDYKTWSLETLPLKMYPIQYQPSAKCVGQVKTILELIKRDDIQTIVHCGDPDDEGQLLVDEVLVYAGTSKPVKRVLINDNTPAAVKKSLQNMQENRKFQGLSNKALARSAGDAIYGMSMTRAYTIPAQANGYKGVLSVGRVQTPTLGLIVRRWRDHKDHASSFYYTLTGTFLSGTDRISARWKASENAPLDDKKRLNSKKWGEGLSKTLKGISATVSAAGIDQKETPAPLPFNLSRLQQYMNKKHKMSIQETLDITQVLKDTYKAITYNRSDCSYLSDEQYVEAPALLDSLKKLDDFKGCDLDSSRKSAAFDSSNVSAHTAIIPTSQIPDLSKLTVKEKTVYLAIAYYYVAQFMPKKRYKEASAHLSCGDEAFITRATTTVDKGFTALLSEEVSNDHDSIDEDHESDFILISRLRTGEKLTCETVEVNENKTKPPSLFTEATLLAAMVRVADFVSDKNIAKLLKDKDKGKKGEHGGIGTPATRAAIIETLKKRNFITLDKQKIIPTEAGLALFDALPASATQPDMTALWAEKQLSIETGDMTVEQFISDLYKDLDSLLVDIRTVSLTRSATKPVGQSGRLASPCPNCQNTIVIRPKLYACTGCEFKIWNTVSEKKLTDNQIETLITKGQTGILKGFKKKADGSNFEARLKLTDIKTGKLGFEFS